MTYRFQYFNGYDQLPERYGDLLEVAAGQGLYSRREWFDSLMSHYYTQGQVMRLYTVEAMDTGKPLLMLPMYLGRLDAAARGAYTLAAIAHSENHAPACILVDPASISQQKELLTALFDWLSDSGGGHDPAPVDVIRLVPFAAESALGEEVSGALESAGYAVQVYANSYNQYEQCAGQSYEDYLSKRSSNQRYNSRRRRRKLEKRGELEFAMITGETSAAERRDAIDEYVTVSIHSWKSQQSTISEFLLEWIAIAAELGYLRLGILRLDGRAIAAQFWVYSGGVANLIRTNFREDFRDLAPGVVLSNMVIEYLLDVDHAESLDFGYGEEDYKGRWVDGARGYVGIMAFNSATWRGYYFGHKHILGQPLKRMLRRGRLALQIRGAV